MPNSQAIATSVPVALLYQTSQRGGHLKDALHELGAAIVYETVAKDFDRVALEGSGARVVVFNLDAESEAQIDHVYDVLDAGNYEVVFNEDDVSSNLSGWDQARWARNLAAKILRRPEIAVPPRPLGAESVPTPLQKLAANVPIAEQPRVAPSGVGRSEQDRTLSAPFEMPASAESAALPQPAEITAAVQASEAPTLQLPVLEEHALEEHALEEPVPQERVQTEQEFPVANFGSALDEFLSQAPASEPDRQDFARELDALFADTRGLASSVPRSKLEADVDEQAHTTRDDAGNQGIAWTDNQQPQADGEFPQIFDQFDAAAAAIPEAIDGAFKPAALTRSAPDESTEPVNTPSAPLIPSDWLLEPIDDDGPPPPAPTGKAKFGIETVTPTEYLAPHVERTAHQTFAPPPANASALELMPMDEAVAPQAYAEAHQQGESRLEGSRPAKKMKIGAVVGVKRVFVLGASIGGPEAVRDFLAALPLGFPVLFILAQHMGEEFLELMSAQLAQAVALTVRNPSHGEHVAQGEIVVVPTTHRLQVDGDGVITLAHLPERAAYSPSIDLVLSDVADQFGDNAGAIIFSGMAQDAIEGSKYLKSKGGVIWAQDPETCAISTMVEGVTQTGVVSFVGSPKELAAKMIADYGGTQG